jgi:hypothetical protein
MTIEEKLAEAKAWMGARYCMHPDYKTNPCPWHSTVFRWPGYDLRDAFKRVRARDQPSFSDVVAQTRQKLRLVYGKVQA